ncbi:hypothetical protein ACOSP7_030953 [Xanthoceras sorbifolium]
MHRRLLLHSQVIVLIVLLVLVKSSGFHCTSVWFLDLVLDRGDVGLKISHSGAVSFLFAWWELVISL